MDLPLLAHQPHRHWCADADQRQLGLLEIALHPQRILVDQRHRLGARADIVARMQVQVGDDAIDRRPHLRALQVQRRRVAPAMGFRQRRLRRLHARQILLMGFRRHQVAQRRVAPRLAPRLRQRRLGAGDLRFGFLQRQPVTGRVDDEQQVARLHPLVVAHRHRRHQPADVGGHAHHVGAHAPVARPGAALIMVPHPDRGQSGGDDQDDGDGAADQRLRKAVHKRIPRVGTRRASPPRINMKILRSTAAR